MNITLYGLLAAILLLAIPLYIDHAFQLHLFGRLLKSIGLLLLNMGILTLIVYFIVLANHPAVTLLGIVVLTAVSAAFTVGRARLNKWRMWIPVFLGLLPVVLLVTFYLTFLSLGQSNPFKGPALLSLAGILTGSVIGINARALSVYHMGLRHHHQLYYYLIGNGATHREAVAYLLRRSLQASLLPSISRMGYTVAAVTPLVFWTSVMLGQTVISACLLELTVILAVPAVSLSSLFLTLLLSRRYAFDEYERIKTKEQPVARQPKNEAPVE
ncbi:MAG: ABC transporter permease [Prevotella sp.]|jgi:putative ABC transport system permease protein